MRYDFRKATFEEATQIWDILRKAIERRKSEGSKQWQDGYPNPDVIAGDIEKGVGYVLTENKKIIGYSVVLKNDEPVYENIVGQWLTSGDFLVVHRVAIADSHLRKGFAKEILARVESLALQNNIFSVKADTNFDNPAMLRIFEQLGYVYCGKIHFRGSERLAYEKMISNALSPTLHCTKKHS
ncbi:MAG: GNAT family N-acetyltransferase [Paludibacteraceae bacterium]